VLDFGQNFSGVLRFENHLPYGEKILLQTGEVLQNGCFYRENLLPASSDFLSLSDGIPKTVEEAFTFHGFRYVKVLCSQEVRAEDFTGVVLSSDLRELLRCETSHPLLNRLLENTRWSRLSNFLDVPTDCPQRDERLGWTGDAQAFVDTACCQADCRAFYRKYMEDLRIDQTRYYHGDLPMFSPSLRGKAGIGGAVWADAGVIIPWRVYMHYGDTELLRENYPMMRDYTDVRIQKDRDLGFTHVLFDEFTFGDWLALDGLSRKSVFGGTEETFIQGIYYLQAVELTGKAAGILGKKEDAEHYASLALDIRRSLMREYVTEGGRLALDTQTAYVLALRHGLYHDRLKMTEALKRRLRRDSYELRCGFTGAPLLLSVLLDNGLVDEAYRILFSEDYPGWLYEIRHGATTIWERWNSLEEDGRVSDTGMDSFNHYAYGAVCYAVYSRIMGLHCTAPGWKQAEIAPKVRGMLRRSRIEQDTVSGLWKAAWEIAGDGSFSLLVTVPTGCTAHVVLPDHPDHLEEDAGEGEHRYEYMPARDWLHPFDEHSLILDIMRNPQADALFAAHAPGLHALAWDPDSDVRAKHLDELSWGVPRSIRGEAAGLGEKLRQVELT
ncbi:MAG: family 78 glycoside hydrolase catalytic domain, partial [Clostridiales bacterium]|nr:family 78 glycoside hydrolase catalytic domain [Clostridiales bacterium]